MNGQRSAITLPLLFVVLFLCTAFIYFPGLFGPFLLDDFHNLEPLGYWGGVYDVQGALRFIFGNNSGPFGRPVAMASFLLDDNTWPAIPFSFKATSLCFHLLTGIFVFLMTRKLLSGEFAFKQDSADRWGLLVCGFWLLSPLQVSTVLYVIQRMALLAALFSVMGFYFYLLARENFKAAAPFRSVVFALLCCLALLLGVLSKENALLLPVFIVLAEVLAFRPWWVQQYAGGLKKAAFLLAVIVPLLLFFTYDRWGSTYAGRDFTFWDRIALQPAILGDYFLKLVAPSAGRINLFDERFSSIHEVIDQGYYWLGLSAFVALIALLVVAFHRKSRLVTFGILWFFVFHLLESSIFPLEMYFEHRNYLPSIGIAILLVPAIRSLNRFLPTRGIRLTVSLVGLSYLVFVTGILARTWSEPTGLFLKFAGDEPESVRAKLVLATHMESLGLPEFSADKVRDATELRPDLVSLPLTLVFLDCKYGIGVDQQKNEKRIQESSRYDLGAYHVLRKLAQLELSEGRRCFEGYSFDLEYLLNYATKLNGFGYSNVIDAQHWNLMAEYYAGKKDFAKTLFSLEKAIGNTPTVDLLLKQTVLYTSAGNYDAALESIELALKADSDKANRLTPSRRQELEFVKQSLIKQREKSLKEGG